MKKLLLSKSQIEIRYKLLKFIYTNRKSGSSIPNRLELVKLLELNKITIKPEEVDDFYEYMNVTGITQNNKINLNYNQAVKEIEKLLIV